MESPSSATTCGRLLESPSATRNRASEDPRLPRRSSWMIRTCRSASASRKPSRPGGTRAWSFNSAVFTGTYPRSRAARAICDRVMSRRTPAGTSTSTARGRPGSPVSNTSTRRVSVSLPLAPMPSTPGGSNVPSPTSTPSSVPPVRRTNRETSRAEQAPSSAPPPDLSHGAPVPASGSSTGRPSRSTTRDHARQPAERPYACRNATTECRARAVAASRARHGVPGHTAASASNR